MVIYNNLMADNSNRFLKINSAGQASSMEKLASGLRINRAADDAAGLAISEKMRNQVSGLNQASRNSQDGISLIQTAEGALAESQAMLQRMRELSIQSMNDTYTDSDREKINLEVQQLLQEIDGIADKTEFNEQRLLAGDGDGAVTLSFVSDAGVDYTDMTLAELEAELEVQQEILDELDVETELAAVTDILDELDTLLEEKGYDADTEFTFTTADSTSPAGITSLPSASGIKFEDMTTAQKLALYDVLNSGQSLTDLTSATGVDIDYDTSASTPIASAGATAYDTLTTEIGAAGHADINDVEGLMTLLNEIETIEEAIEAAEKGFNTEIAGSLTFEFHVGANENQKISVEIAAMGVYALALEEVDMSTKELASASLSLVDSAIESISEQRAILGAAQNRLEHTIKNVDNTSENLQTAESNIRDTDMASEMVILTKFNILSQASQSMLSQANQLPQNVLQLL